MGWDGNNTNLESVLDRPTDQRTNGPTDQQSDLKSCVYGNKMLGERKKNKAVYMTASVGCGWTVAFMQVK